MRGRSACRTIEVVTFPDRQRFASPRHVPRTREVRNGALSDVDDGHHSM
jgi:hypothetical protein